MSNSVETYRSQAREIADLADKAEDPTIKAELLALAERFWRLADYVESRHQGSTTLSSRLSEHDRY